MPSLKHIKTTIKSVNNLKKITNALEVVSTVKLQKIKSYAESLKDYLVDLTRIISASWIDLADKNKIQWEIVIFLTSERWLNGSLNTKLAKKLFQDKKPETTKYFVVWKKWLDLLSRTGKNIIGHINLKDDFDDSDILPLTTLVLQNIETHKITIYFNYFKNVVTQIPTSLQINPINQNTLDEFLDSIEITKPQNFDIANKEVILEPSIKELKKEIKRQLVNYMIVSALIQNKSSEFAARMMAMKNAKDNSNSLINQLVLSYNKARQSVITKEISEIVSAKIAIEG